MDWLLKTEPSEYSFGDLTREKTTVWTGVKNPVAVRHLRSMKKGDRAVIYHTGEEKRAVGLATVVSDGRDDPKDPRTAAVDLKAGALLRKPVSLAEIRANRLFADSPLLKVGRLSVVPLTPEQYRLLSGS